MEFSTVLSGIGAISPILLLVVAAVLKRRLDRVTAEKIAAEGRLTDATEAKVKQETAGLIIDHASRLVNEFREYQGEKDKLGAERLAAAEARSQTIDTRMSRMEEAFTRLRAVLATHGVWDTTALIELRQTHGDYPEPPPLPQSLDVHRGGNE